MGGRLILEVGGPIPLAPVMIVHREETFYDKNLENERKSQASSFVVVEGSLASYQAGGSGCNCPLISLTS